MLDPLNPDWLALHPTAGLALNDHRGATARFTTADGPFTVTAYADNILRLTLGTDDRPTYPILDAAPDPRQSLQYTRGQYGTILSAGDWRLTLQDEPLRFTLTRGREVILASTADGHFRRSHRLPPFARTPDGWFAAFNLESQEPVYGLGESWGRLNHRGGLQQSWVEDALGVNAAVAYKCTPLALSPTGWGVFVHTSCRVNHAIGHPPWSHRAYALEVEDRTLDLFIIIGRNLADLIERYTHLTGRPPAPPDWSLGVWLSKAYYRDEDELLNAAHQARARDIPAEVIVLDGRTWLDTRTRFAFEFDSQRYPNPAHTIDTLHQMGYRVCLWEYPLVSIYHPLFAEMAARGWLLRAKRSGDAYCYQWDQAPFGDVLTPLPTSGIVDFTHPEAYAYWRDRHKELFDLGIDVIKSDFGEQVPHDAVAHNGDSGTRLHNVYPLLYNKCVYEATARYGPRGSAPLVFARAAWAGSQRYPGFWGGDPQSDWQGMAASLRGALSWGFAGSPCYATDIGGFYGQQPDKELFVRWTQMAVFASHMRFHGIGPREPWSYGGEAEAIVRRYLKLRVRLIPYIRTQLQHAEATGMPLMRAMPLACPDEPQAWIFNNQFYFGPDLLVAPVLNPGGRVRFYLPTGRWRGAGGGGLIEGGRMIETVMPLDDIPVFVSEGSELQTVLTG